jgi:hypothetical protein
MNKCTVLDWTGRDGTERDRTVRDGTGRNGTGRGWTGRDVRRGNGTVRDGTGRDGMGRDGNTNSKCDICLLRQTNLNMKAEEILLPPQTSITFQPHVRIIETCAVPQG